MAWTIYCHVHRESGRRYVGLTKRTWQERWRGHLYGARRGVTTHFANAIRKYGPEAFDHEVLQVCSTLEEANEREQHWITHFNTRNPLYGFNLTPGGAHVPHPIRNPWDDPAYRTKQMATSKSRWTPEKRAALAASHIGVKLSDSHRAAISKARFGKDHAPEVRERINAKIRETYSRPEVRVQHSAPSLANWQDPEYRAKIATFDGTHKLCKRHGPVSLDDCYARKNRYGNSSYECKECWKLYRARYRSKQAFT